MNSMEETLWNYIDGNCTPEEEKAIVELIEKDASVSGKYAALLKLNKEFSMMDMDEPPMAFTYNVMEAIRTENAQVPLKAAFNKQIIKGIGLFFTLTLLALLVLVFTSVKWSGQGLPVNLAVSFKMPQIDFSKARFVVQGFVFFDVMLGLYLLDAYLRSKRTQRLQNMA